MKRITPGSLGLVAVTNGAGMAAAAAFIDDTGRDVIDAHVHALRAHAVEVFAGRVHRSLGHNPLGQWMAYLLWVLILTLALTGWMSRLDEFWGEEWLTDLHEALADGLMACLAVHLLGVAAMSRMQGENLVRAMITGRKRA